MDINFNLFPYNGKNVRVVDVDGDVYEGNAYVSSDYDMDDMCFVELPNKRGDPVVIYADEIASIEIIN